MGGKNALYENIQRLKQLAELEFESELEEMLHRLKSGQAQYRTVKA